MTECFFRAHREVLKDMGDSEESDKLKKYDVELLIRKFFSEEGGDYDNPTREDLLKVSDRLKEFASKFRSEKTIEMHYKEIMDLIQKLE